LRDEGTSRMYKRTKLLII